MNTSLILASLIEGITEFLPVSSTAHLIIFSKLTSIDLADAYIKFYLLFIQLGALLAGVLLFSKKILTDSKTSINIICSFIPSAAIGFVLYKSFKKLLEGNIILLVGMLALGALIFMYLEKVYIKKDSVQRNMKDRLTKKDAFIVGLAQAVAIIPGVSRSGATIIAGMFRGIKKAVIVEYTFLLAIPTLGAAVLYDAYKSRDIFSSIINYKELGLGFLVAAVSGYATLSIVKKYLPRLSLTAFGWYRIILAIMVMFLLY